MVLHLNKRPPPGPLPPHISIHLPGPPSLPSPTNVLALAAPGYTNPAQFAAAALWNGCGLPKPAISVPGLGGGSPLGTPPQAPRKGSPGRALVVAKEARRLGKGMGLLVALVVYTLVYLYLYFGLEQ